MFSIPSIPQISTIFIGGMFSIPSIPQSWLVNMALFYLHFHRAFPDLCTGDSKVSIMLET